MKTPFLRTIFLLLAVSAISFSTQAQSNSPDAHLSGRLTDLSGYGIGNVKITAQLQNNPSARLWSAISSPDGSYLLPFHRAATTFISNIHLLSLVTSFSI